jgi:hypothetical protein
LPSKPSISVSSWLSVCSRSSLPPPMPAQHTRHKVQQHTQHDCQHLHAQCNTVGTRPLPPQRHAAHLLVCITVAGKAAHGWASQLHQQPPACSQ